MSKSIIRYNSDSGIPPEYRYENDYRNIPQKYLKNNIPQGRKMIKWAPFATMLQQFEELKKMIEKQTRVSRPSLSEDQLVELNSKLLMYMNRPEECVIHIFNEGYIQTLKGFIMEVNAEHKTLMFAVEDYLTIKNISLTDIISIE
ncbi:YolD-like family protein [Macrococcus bovicus]|uniref:YolD-like family protein n=1 Tax=Macrococcus bovicus TaxID=69968 RepID=UPI0025A53B04|nr:YolD-like family protein [Macrococcus bovicus]WJP96704.1 YolD-like family protein [Macrococcus bovicus]